MDIKIVKKRLSQRELEKIAKENYGEMAKGVADVKQKIIALGGELHADAEAMLLEHGSKQNDLWGFNIYTNRFHNDRIEYTSLINIRPSQNNRTIEIQDEKLKEQIKKIIDSLIE